MAPNRRQRRGAALRVGATGRENRLRTARDRLVDPIRRKGHRFRGVAEVHTEGAVYERIVSRFQQRRGTDPARVNSAVLVKGLEVGRLVSPAYDDGTSEEAIAARWRARLTVDR